MRHFFHNDLSKIDSDVFHALENELNRQQNSISLIASENIVSRAVLEAQGSVLTNKYAEGYPGARYYGGCQYADVVENIAIERAKKLFNANFANVQPHSGSQANQGVFMALLEPQDKILGLSLDCGGHLTHGSKVNQSGKWFQAFHYGVHKESGLIDYEEIERLAKEHRPKLIIAGVSSYPRQLNFHKFREIANEINAYLMVDMAHFAGLVAADLYDNPINHCDVITTTTHKTLRSARGGMILTNNEEIHRKVQKAIFPGIQGGPLMHSIAGKAVGFGEALTDEFRRYTEVVMQNAKILGQTLENRGYKIFTDGTDTHFILVDLRNHGITGKDAETSLCNAMLICNKNTIPYDTAKPTITSGIRLGTPSGTTRGMRAKEFELIGNLIADVCNGLKENGLENNNKIEEQIRESVFALCTKFPIYSYSI